MKEKKATLGKEIPRQMISDKMEAAKRRVQYTKDASAVKRKVQKKVQISRLIHSLKERRRS